MERSIEEIVWCAEVNLPVGCVYGDISRQLDVRRFSEFNILAMVSQGISEKKNPGEKSLFCLFIKKYQNMYFFHLIVSFSRQGPEQ